jgi:hypothetical protein
MVRQSAVKKDSLSPFKTNPRISTEPRSSDIANNDAIIESLLKMSL